MATYTPNYNLSKPENTDTQSSFILDYCDNMDKIDANLGGGGGGGGSVFLNTIYTDTEKRVGFWRDNKPLYQKTIQFSNVPQNTSNFLIATGVSDIDTMVLQEAYGISASNNIYPLPLALRASTADYNTYSINFQGYVKASNSFRIDTGSQVSVPNGFITFQYTKTTDTPEPNPQFGNVIYLPTIYSDEERQVGVWRDNKPLYQITINYGTLPSTANVAKDVNHNIANVDEIWVAGGFATNGTFANQLNLSGVNNGEWYFGATSTYIRCVTQSNRSAYSAYVTIQYTKTTDVAGSGNWNTDGIPTHHYSTNEQVIGTWMGKPLYERTWDFGSDFVMSNPNTWYPTTISISANHIKRVIEITSAFSSVGTLWDNLGLAININDYVQLNSSRNTGGEAIQYLTLRYTKTTD